MNCSHIYVALKGTTRQGPGKAIDSTLDWTRIHMFPPLNILFRFAGLFLVLVGNLFNVGPVMETHEFGS